MAEFDTIFVEDVEEEHYHADFSMEPVITAQVLRKKNSIVCEVLPDVLNIPQTTSISGIQANPGDVYIFKKGRGIPYYGKRSTRALLNHLFKVNGTQLKWKFGKNRKTFFLMLLRVAFGFFTRNEKSKLESIDIQIKYDHQAFEEAAAHLSPSVRFYAAYDRTVAKHLKLNSVGEIHLVKPFTKTPIVCPQNPASAADIEAFVKANQGSFLTKITEHNLNDPSLFDPSKILVLAIAEEASSLGGYFYRLITKLARNNTNNTEFANLNIVWLEPHIFPSIHLVMDELETILGIPNKLPAFGALNITTLKSSWLNTATLNCSGDKNSDAQNLQVLQEFLTGVITNTLVPVRIGVQSFVQTPTSQTVVENSEIVLECVVENPIGDCLWLKDGRNIGYNLDRYPHYNWRGDRLTGDCSLIISGATAGRDNGEWVCEVTGDLDNPTLTSNPVKILITAAEPSPSEQAKTEL
ncbi:calsequestrin-2 [Trichonephila inaurata madagascariensis]|uniref:Calsequestrin n=1 Tax=Trichonephila inaurata madagascariensis TaxID=2747483 RepID=A0A8X7C863_9ARAC|nr:calsequestrin-2 [Trichonephila inaurata madagascariensis]